MKGLKFAVPSLHTDGRVADGLESCRSCKDGSKEIGFLDWEQASLFQVTIASAPNLCAFESVEGLAAQQKEKLMD